MSVYYCALCETAHDSVGDATRCCSEEFDDDGDDQGAAPVAMADGGEPTVEVSVSTAREALTTIEAAIRRTGGTEAMGNHPIAELVGDLEDSIERRDDEDLDDEMAAFVDGLSHARMTAKSICANRGVESNPDVDPLTDATFQARNELQDVLEGEQSCSSGEQRTLPDGGTPGGGMDQCGYCDGSELVYELKPARGGSVYRCIECLAIEQGQQQLRMPFDVWIDRDDIEPPESDDAPDFEPFDPTESDYLTARAWFTVLARLKDDDPIVKRDSDAIGTIYEDTREFLTNLMGEDAHKRPSELRGECR